MFARLSSSARLVWLTFFFYTLFYWGWTRGHCISSDELLVYQPARSLWQHGIPNITSKESTFSIPGRHDLSYGTVSTGQAVLALPLIGLGRFLDCNLPPDWADCLAGSARERAGFAWSGETEMFCALLLNGILMGLVCAVYLAFQLRLGVAPRNALIATAAVGLSSFLAGYSTSLFTHSAEGLGILWAAYFLYCDRQRPAAGFRWAAGIALAATIQCRFPAVVLWPAFLLYHTETLLRRCPHPKGWARELAPLTLAASAGLLLHAADQWWKFASLANQGPYAQVRFSTPLGLSWAGYWLSPGHSLLLFMPILWLAPAWLRWFWGKRPLETALILGVCFSQLWVYGHFQDWHGLLCYGPRYLAAVTPLLCLPLGGWLQAGGRVRQGLLWTLIGLGLLVQLLHFSVDYSKVGLAEGWNLSVPRYAYLFTEQGCVILSHLRAWQSGDERVDFWIANLIRTGHAEVALGLIALWMAGLLGLARLLQRELRAAPEAIDFSPLARRARLSLLLIALGSLGLRLSQPLWQGSDPEARLCRAGEKLLRLPHSRRRAEQTFRLVLQRSPGHPRALRGLKRARQA